jgi:radical SAM/Cys-rich protein
MTYQPSLRRAPDTRWQAEISAHRATVPHRQPLEVLQVNLGRYCNIKCQHCHVNAGPERIAEVMSSTVRERVMDWIEQYRPIRLDLTGGAPELIAGFRDLVRFARARGIHVMDRNNLVCHHEPGQEDLADFLATQQVEVIASLPCYSRENVDHQRGDGVFMASIRALELLNAVGYGVPGSGLELNLIYNPIGAALPPPQAALEQDYRDRLQTDFGIVFSRLYCMTNLPIARFLRQLYKEGKLSEYWDLLSRNFRTDNLTGLMCRTTLSVGYDGRVYDCDFNQMLSLPLADRQPRYLWELEPADWSTGTIAFRDHCLGCTAGAGSSCGGQVSASQP